MKNVALLFYCLVMTSLSGQDTPKLFEGFDSRTEIIETDEGDFLAWIVDGSDAKKLFPKLRKLPKIEVDREDVYLVFIIYSDEEFEYVIARNKWRHRRLKFNRVTAYRI